MRAETPDKATNVILADRQSLARKVLCATRIDETRDLFEQGKAKDSKPLLNRARNISRRPSRRADHH
jgi:hypothetical protein